MNILNCCQIFFSTYNLSRFSLNESYTRNFSRLPPKYWSNLTLRKFNHILISFSKSVVITPPHLHDSTPNLIFQTTTFSVKTKGEATLKLDASFVEEVLASFGIRAMVFKS